MKNRSTHTLSLCASLTALLLAAFCMMRIFFYCAYRELYAEVPVREIFVSFLVGVRFDFASAMILYGFFFLLLFLPFSFVFSLRFRKIVLFFLFVVSILSLLLSFGDIVYYQFVKRRISYEIFSLFSGFPEIATMIVKGFAIEILFALLILLIFSFVFWKTVAVYLCDKKIDSGKNWVQGVLFLCMCVVIVIAIRGGVQLKPLRESYAFRNDNVALGHLSLNPIFTVARTLIKENNDTHYFEHQEIAVENVRALLNNDEIFTDSEYPLMRKKRSATMNTLKYNVVIFMMESWGAKNIGALGSKYNTTPYFDTLVQQGILFTNFFAAGQRTIQGMQAVIGALPTFSYNDIIGSPMEQNSFRCLGNILKENGYQTLFVHGARSGSMGFDAFAHIAGFDKIIAKEDYDLSQVKDDGTWGIFDEYIFERAHNEFLQLQQPFCGVVFSLTSHSPYSLPSQQYEYFNDTVSNYRYLNALRYSDNALRKFFSEAKKEKYFSNTIFIIVADHVEGFGEKTMYERFHIPCLIYAPHILSPQIIATVHSQVDVVPTVLELLNVQSAHASFGTSAIQNHPSFAFVSEGAMYGWIQDSFFLFANEEKNIGLYNFINDVQMQHNVISLQENNAAATMRKKLLSYLQVGTNALRDNRIYKK
jgi:phosphoglycerol transferase MdoB-like AlkP superfamily enzyme